MMFYALVALCLSASALAQVADRGECPYVNIQQNFDVSRFEGRWYEQQRFFTLFELNAKCAKFDYTAGRNNSIHVQLSYTSGFTGQVRTIERNFIASNPRVPARNFVNFPLGPPGLSEILFLGSDYTNYAVIYSCKQIGRLNMKYAWILTRKRFPSQFVMDKAYEVIARNRIDGSNFWQTEQKNC